MYQRLSKIVLSLALIFAEVAFGGSNEIKITNGEWAPYLSEKVKSNGIASHIIEEAFKAVNIKVKWGFFPWSRSLKLAKKGKQWKAGAVWLKTEKREKEFYFSDPVVETEWNFFYFKTTKFEWSTIKDLNRYKVGMTQDYSYGKSFDKGLKAGAFKVQKAKSDKINFLKMAKKRIEVFPIDKLVGLTMLKELKNSNPKLNFSEMTYHPKPLHSTPLHLIFSKVEGNKAFVKSFNKGLKLIKENGIYEKIMEEAKKGAYGK